MEPYSITRLVLALSGAGYLLLALEIFFPATGFAIFAGLTLLGSIGLTFYHLGLDTGAIALLVHTTVVSVGMVVVLTLFPKSPLGRKFLRDHPPAPADEDTPGN